MTVSKNTWQPCPGRLRSSRLGYPTIYSGGGMPTQIKLVTMPCELPAGHLGDHITTTKNGPYVFRNQQ